MGRLPRRRCATARALRVLARARRRGRRLPPARCRSPTCARCSPSRGAQARHALESVADLVAGREQADASRSVLDSTTDDPDGWYADDRRPSRLRRCVTRPGHPARARPARRHASSASARCSARACCSAARCCRRPRAPATCGRRTSPPGTRSARARRPTHPPGSCRSSLLAGVLRGSASARGRRRPAAESIPLAGLTVLPRACAASWSSTWARALGGGRVRHPAGRHRRALRRTPRHLGRRGAAARGSRAPARACSAWAVPRPGAARSAPRCCWPSWPSFTPVVWLLVTVLLAVVAGVHRGPRPRRRGCACSSVVLTPVALLVPWSLRVLREPALLWLEPGHRRSDRPDAHSARRRAAAPGRPGLHADLAGRSASCSRGIVAIAVPGRPPPIVARVGGRRVAALVLGVIEPLPRVVAGRPGGAGDARGPACRRWSGAAR